MILSSMKLKNGGRQVFIFPGDYPLPGPAEKPGISSPDNLVQQPGFLPITGSKNKSSQAFTRELKQAEWQPLMNPGPAEHPETGRKIPTGYGTRDNNNFFNRNQFTDFNSHHPSHRNSDDNGMCKGDLPGQPGGIAFPGFPFCRDRPFDNMDPGSGQMNIPEQALIRTKAAD